MSDEKNHGLAFGFALVFALGLVVGVATGSGYRNHVWESRLVDDPARVEATRARVLAQRAEAEVSK
jgi:hypothetical protein